MGIDRKSIEEKYKWNIDEMYQSSQDMEADIQSVKNLIEELKSYKGKLGESKESLYNVLKKSEEASRKLQNLYVYTNMKKHEDTRINENQGKATKIDMLATDLSMATSYMVPEIIAMDDNKLQEFLKDENLKFYKKHIDDILRVKPHTLSEKEEEILAAASELSGVPENVYEIFSFADLKFPEIKGEDGELIRITHGNYSTLLKSKNERVRKDAFEALYSTYEEYKNTFASTLYGGIKSEIFYAKMRNYKSALEGSLFQDDISVDVYNNLIAAVDENLDTLNKYVDIRKKYLNIDEMHMYDLYVPITSNFDMKITYEEAKEIILKALKPLGEEYLSIVQKAFDERWIDVYENEGKQGGAYSWGSYDSAPYILMSYKDD